MATPQPDPNHPPATNPPTTPYDDQPAQRPARDRPEGCALWVAILVVILLVIAFFARPADDPETPDSAPEPAIAVSLEG